MKHTQKIPISLNTAWSFFSKPENLKQIMPKDVKFNLISPVQGTPLHAGQIIEYKVKTKLGFHIPWVSEITEVEDKQYFIDEQKMGIFGLWQHQHFFVEIPGGVEMTDIITYKLRFGIVGQMAHKLFMKKRIEQIFYHRSKHIESMFGRFE
ncbi:SRPBCC family protein [Ferruginibacter albus]|uniref:SRPBCC family protein n=1 Tax=Ferruginibacter albus TaxID=2875540 RepID=UPI001CC4D390|nr:SRPBCC family protein [Ferruginibacter albus]UAY52205.1 SRPBCC family protein [Ferruginibacter albus]